MVLDPPRWRRAKSPIMKSKQWHSSVISKAPALLLVLLILASAISGWGATFPLPIPTRPTSFPLQRPKVTGTVVSWGNNDNGQTNVQAGLRSVVAVAAGGNHTVALKNDGTVVAWGRGTEGQTTVPASLMDVVAIAAGGNHTVALKSDGTVVAWGGSSGQSSVPLGLSGVVAVAAGYAHTVAVVSDDSVVGRMVSWGLITTMPGGLSGIISAASGYQSTIALRTDGTMTGWGDDSWSQITVASRLSNFVAVAMGSVGGPNSAIGLQDDGTVVAWGYNGYGQTNVPAGLTEVVAIAAGSGHMVALKSDGLVGPNGATGKAQVVSGFMVSISVTRGGHGYTAPPLVVIRGGGGAGAVATAVLTDGVVTGFVVSNPGIGYTSVPQVVIASPLSAPELSVSVSRVNVAMKVILGRKYQLQSSTDLMNWALVGSSFVADNESINQEFVVAETGRYFQLVEVP